MNENILTEGQKKEILKSFKRFITESGELKNPTWVKIKTALIPMGFKSQQYSEKGGYYSGEKGQFDIEELRLNNVNIHYPYQETEGAKRNYDAIRIGFQQLQPDKLEVVKQFIRSGTLKTDGISDFETSTGNLTCIIPLSQGNNVISVAKEVI